MHNMQYPLISEYVKAIQDASDNLEQLAYLTPVLDDHGEPYRSGGAFACGVDANCLKLFQYAIDKGVEIIIPDNSLRARNMERRNQK